MSSPPAPDRAATVRERLAARARRATTIRRRVAAAALATFVLAWGAIVWDGSMGVPATTSAAAQPAATATATPSQTTGTTPLPEPTPVTTRQS